MKKFLLSFALLFIAVINPSFAAVIFNTSKSSVMQVTYSFQKQIPNQGDTGTTTPVEVTINPASNTGKNYVEIPEPKINLPEVISELHIEKVVIKNANGTMSSHVNACRGMSSLAYILDDMNGSLMLLCTNGTVS